MTSQIQVKVKTLDAQTHAFSVDPQISVKDFKCVIQPTVNVESAQQRLIYCGKVLADEKSLSEYDITDGKTVHLVIRLPPASSSGSSTSNAADQNNADPMSGRRSAPPGQGYENGQLLGAVYVPRTGFEMGNFQQIVQDVITNLGDLGRNATVMSATSEDGSSVDVHINLGQIMSQSQTNAQVQSRVNQIRQLLASVDRDLRELENPERTSTPTQQPASPMPMDHSGGQFGSSSEAAEAAIAAAAAAETAAQLARQAAAVVAASVYSSGFGAPNTPPRPVVSTPQIRVTARQVSTPRLVRRVAPSTSTTGGSRPSNVDSDPQSVPQVPGPQNALPAAEFADIIQSVRLLEERVRSHVISLEDSLRETTASSSRNQQENVRLHRAVSSIMHQFGHVYYLLSDLYVCFHQPLPRSVGLYSSAPVDTNFSQPPPSHQPAAPVRPPRSASVPRTRPVATATIGAAPPTGLRIAGAPLILLDYGPTIRIQGNVTPATIPQPNNDGTPSSTPVPVAQASQSGVGVPIAETAPGTRVSVGIPASVSVNRSAPLSIPVAAVTVPVMRPSAVPIVAGRAPERDLTNWEAAVSPAWLPIIRADLLQQQENPPPRDTVFSEAYLNGIPNRKKRRTDGDDSSGSGGGSRA